MAAPEIDPVCGMKVDPARAKATAEHRGKTFYFCCTGCAEKFRANPDKYLGANPRRRYVNSVGRGKISSGGPRQDKSRKPPDF